MSFATLVTLTVIEILLLVIVLAIFLILLTRRLKAVAKGLSRVAWGVRAVEIEVAALGPSVGTINEVLEDLTVNLLPGALEKATRLAAS